MACLTKWSNLVPLRSTGQNLSRGFVVLLRKSIPQDRNLNSAVYHGVRVIMKLALLIIMYLLSLNSLAVDLTEAEKCKKNGGEFVKTGRHRYSCITSLADGGKKCMNSTQCIGGCEAVREFEYEINANSEPKILKSKEAKWKQYGQCAKNNSPSCKPGFENGVILPALCM